MIPLRTRHKHLKKEASAGDAHFSPFTKKQWGWIINNGLKCAKTPACLPELLCSKVYPPIQNNSCWWRAFLQCVSWACSGVSQSVSKGPWPLFGILFYLFSPSSVRRMRSREEGVDEDERQRWEDEEEEEYKRIKRREEGMGERQREEEDAWKAGSSGRIAGRAPVTEEAPAFCHPLLLSFFPSISFCPATGRTPKRGKEWVLKIPPSFLCPSPLLKTCCLHSNRPCPHTELIQLVVMNVCVCSCVWGRERECVFAAAHASLCLSVFVCQCASVHVVVVFVFVLFFQGRGSVNVSPTLRPHSFTETSSLSQFIFGQGSVGWFLKCKKFFQSLSFKSGTVMLRTSLPWKHKQQSVRPTALPPNGSPVCAQLVCWVGKAAIGRPSAAGGGRDRAVVQVGRVHHRNREVENERRGGCCWRRGGRRWGLGPEQRAHCGGRFCGTRSGEELRLELQQLAHEAEVGGDDAATPAHKLEGFV